MVLCNIKGEIITPESADYNKDRQIFNRAIQRFPSVIAYCEDYGDVSSAIQCARENDIPIRIRSGGHNYEGYSVGDRVFVIDISKLDSIKIDYESGTVTVGGGVTMSKLYDTVSGQGYPFPGGTCPTVCVSGFCLGGGWGLTARKLGLGCDALLEVRLIDCNGKLIIASAHCNQDLFWALRGAGGGNFGVAVSFTFRLPPRTGRVSFFELTYPDASPQLQLRFFSIFQKWIVSVTPDINVQGGIYNSAEDGIYVYMRGICFGDPDRTRELLEPFYFTEQMEEEIQYGSFLQIMNRIESSYPPSEKFKSTGRFSNQLYTLHELCELLTIVNSPRPDGSVLTSLSFYGLGGKVADKAPEETAFYFRRSHYILLIQSVWEEDRWSQPNRRFVLNNFPALYNLTDGSYINFPLAELPDYMENYYGNNSSRLVKVKRKYDPEDVFCFHQSIPV